MKSAESTSPCRGNSPPPSKYVRSPRFRKNLSRERKRSHSQEGERRRRSGRYSRSQEDRDVRASPPRRRSRTPTKEAKIPFSSKRKSHTKGEREKGYDSQDDTRANHIWKRSRSKSQSPIDAKPPVLHVDTYSPPLNEPAVKVTHTPRCDSPLPERFKTPGQESYGGFVRPVFHGSNRIGYDIQELKSIAINIVRSFPGDKSLNVDRNITNTDDIILIRRPGEGSHPIFARQDILQANKLSNGNFESSFDHRSVSTVEYRRVVRVVNNSPQVQMSDESQCGPSHMPNYYAREYSRPPSDYGHPNEYKSKNVSRIGSPDTNKYHHFERDSNNLQPRINEIQDHRCKEDHSSDHNYPRMKDEIRQDRHSRSLIRSPTRSDRRRGPVDKDTGYCESESEGNKTPPMFYRPRKHTPDRFREASEFSSQAFHGVKSWRRSSTYIPMERPYFKYDGREDIRRPFHELGPRGHMHGRRMMRGYAFRGRAMSRGFFTRRRAGWRGSSFPR